MYRYLKYIAICLLLSSQAQAVQCYITVVKGSCWKDYDVTISALNAETSNKVVDVVIPKGQLTARAPFTCQPGDTLSMSSKFSPEFWKGDEMKVFKAIRFWALPEKAESNTIGWNVSVCFPQGFSDVPQPPESSGQCECDMESVPKLQAVDISS
ncbi:MAG: hypothetical protein P1U74_11290 [Legionellaceae bacterium]|nr:hypothetical protein [Legionellaceae bacterium]